MKDDVKLGIFLCACGEKIGGRLNLVELQEQLSRNPEVSHCSIHSYLCEEPDLAVLTREAQARGLNRVLLGACSDLIMKKKFAAALKPLGITASQIDLVNLKDHVAAVHEDGSPVLTRKAAALLTGGVCSLGMLEPFAPRLADFQGPALILGGGISGFAAAQELAHNGMESLVFSGARNPGDVLAELHRTYPGSHIFLKDLEAMLAGSFRQLTGENGPGSARGICGGPGGRLPRRLAARSPRSERNNGVGHHPGPGSGICRRRE